MKDLQNKSIPGKLELKETREDGVMHIKAYALAFGNVDSYGDVIIPTACDKFLASEEADRMRLCYQHDRADVIGVITGKGVDSYGMWIEADILPTALGKDVQLLLDKGALNEFSIGYRCDKASFKSGAEYGYPYEVRLLEEITIREVSLVSIAANPKAVLLDKKDEEPQAEQEIKNEEEQPSITDTDMDEMKRQLEALEQKAASAEQRAVKDAEELKTAQENINNLDASVKSQQATIEALQAQLKREKARSFEEAVKAALEENKDRIEKMFAEKKDNDSIRIEVKMTTGDVTASAYGTSVDPQVGSAPHVGRAFLSVFATEAVNDAKAAWLDGTYTNKADYVEELAKAEDSDATANEVIRQFGKIGTRLLLSSELNDWMNEIANWVKSEAVEFIDDKTDEEVWKGVGGPSAQKKIYGIKGQATAFKKVGSYAEPTVGDVILDAAQQAKRAGYKANSAIVSYATEVEIQGIKDKNNNPIYNAITGMFKGVTIVPSAVLDDAEMLIADSRCAKVLRRPSVEIEITRDADLDGWKVNVRRASQTKVKEAQKKGLIYVADKTAAITAITK